MADVMGRIGDREPQKDAAPGGWRRVLLTTGFFCMLVALFIGAAMREGGSTIPRYLATAGFALVVVSAVASLINWLSVRGSHGAQPIK